MASRPVLASPLLEGWPPSTASRGRNRFTCVTADIFTSQGSEPESPRHSLGQLHGARAFTTISTFQLMRSTRLNLTHQKIAKAAKPAAPTFANSAHFCSKFSSEKQAIALPSVGSCYRPLSPGLLLRSLKSSCATKKCNVCSTEVTKATRVLRRQVLITKARNHKQERRSNLKHEITEGSTRASARATHRQTQSRQKHCMAER